MKSLVTLLLVAAMANPVAAAQCGSRVAVRHANVAVNVVAVPQGFVATAFATPLAVPVAQPVAPYASYYYQQMPYPNEPPQGYDQNPPLSARQQPAYGQRMKAAAPQQTVVETTATGILKAKCVKCHSGDHPKGGLDLSLSLESLPTEARASILTRVMTPDASKKMPKGGATLSFQEYKTLLDEFVH